MPWPWAERLSAELAPLRVGLVHGRLKAADRDREMARFRDGELHVLVGTTVVEVGVDVPNATIMLIEHADRDRQQRVEPAARLVQPLADEVRGEMRLERVSE